MITLLALTLLIAQVDYTYQSDRAILVPEPTYVVCSESKSPKETPKTKELDIQDSKFKIQSSVKKETIKTTKPQYLDFSSVISPIPPDAVEVKVSESKKAECKTEKVTVYFEFDSAVLTESGKQILSSLDKNFTYIVKGYTCSIGTKEYNDNLALRRANAVADFLKQNGIKVESVTGQGKCCYSNSFNTASKENRRSEAVRKCE